MGCTICNPKALFLPQWPPWHFHQHQIPCSLGLFLFLFVVEEPLDAAVDALLQGPLGLVAENHLGLCDVVVPRHGGQDGALLGKGRLLLDNRVEDFARHAEEQRCVARNLPDAGGAGLVAGGAPHGARKVPKVDGLVVCDEEDLAVDALVVEGRRGGGGGGEQQARGQEVRVGDVADVGKVKDVVVVAELHLALAGAVGVEQAGEGLDVALAKDAGGADRRGEQGGRGLGAVGLCDELLGGGLGLGVVLKLLRGADDGPALVGVVEVRLEVADDARGRGVDEGLDVGVPAGVNDGARAVDVDAAKELLLHGIVAGDGRGRVDDDVGPDLVKEGGEPVGVGNVALVVGGVGAAVPVAAQVDRGDVAAAPVVEGLVDNVVAEEAVAADDEDLAQVALGGGVGGHAGLTEVRGS